MINLLKDIKTTRSFSNKKISEKDIKEIINIASIQPTVCFSQSFNIIRITDLAIKNKIIKLLPTQTHIQDSKELLIFTADFNKVNLATKKHKVQIKETNTEMFLMATGDTMIAAQTANIAAQAKGIGTCYLASIRTEAEALSKLLKLPNLVIPVVGLALGYPKDTYPEPERNLKGIQFNNQYDNKLVKSSLDAYDKKIIKHHVELGNDKTSWSSWMKDIVENKKEQSSVQLEKRFKLKK